MVVRVRFARGRVFSGRKAQNSRIARLAASFLTLIAICFGIFGFWRLAQDLGWAGEFVFAAGILSHWQIWLAAAALVQWVAWKLVSYEPPKSGKDEDAAHGGIPARF